MSLRQYFQLNLKDLMWATLVAALICRWFISERQWQRKVGEHNWQMASNNNWAKKEVIRLQGEVRTQKQATTAVETKLYDLTKELMSLKRAGNNGE